MKITLGDNEFQEMVEFWVYKNFVEKAVETASIELDVNGKGCVTIEVCGEYNKAVSDEQ